MKYISVKEASKLWGLSECNVRNYCAPGRVERLIMFKECLRFGVVPFIIDASIKLLYYNWLKKRGSRHGYLIITCQLAQDAFREMLGYFEIGKCLTATNWLLSARRLTLQRQRAPTRI